MCHKSSKYNVVQRPGILPSVNEMIHECCVNEGSDGGIVNNSSFNYFIEPIDI